MLGHLGSSCTSAACWRRLHSPPAIPCCVSCAAGRDDLKLVSVSVNGTPLTPEQYVVAPKSLTIPAASLPAGEFDLAIVTELKPQDNSLLEGLYKSGGNYCTQVGQGIQAEADGGGVGS
jgi:hypothetical protein